MTFLIVGIKNYKYDRRHKIFNRPIPTLLSRVRINIC